MLSGNTGGPAIPVSGHLLGSLGLLLHTKYPGWERGSERLFVPLIY